MHLFVSPDAPWLTRAAANAVLIAHIGAGGVGLLSGAGALVFRKGGRAHRFAGNVFFTSILAMSAIGAGVAPLLPQRSSVVPALLTFYLVATGWMAVRRHKTGVGRFEIGACLFALGIASIGAIFGLRASHDPTGMLDAEPPSTYYVFAVLAALAGASDMRLIVRGGVSGAQRIARHLWRMCAALLIAAISFFLGQQQVFPVSVRGSPILFLPEIAILGLLIFWIFRVRLSKRYKHITSDLSAASRSPVS